MHCQCPTFCTDVMKNLWWAGDVPSNSRQSRRPTGNSIGKCRTSWTLKQANEWTTVLVHEGLGNSPLFMTIDEVLCLAKQSSLSCCANAIAAVNTDIGVMSEEKPLQIPLGISMLLVDWTLDDKWRLSLVVRLFSNLLGKWNASHVNGTESDWITSIITTSRWQTNNSTRKRICAVVLRLFL